MTETREAIAKESVRTSRDPVTRRVMVGLIVLILIFATVVGFAIFKLYSDDEKDDTRNAEAFSQLIDDADTKQAAVQALADQLEALGEKPIVDPASLPTTPSPSLLTGQRGARGPGPTFNQVLAAVGAQIGLAVELNCDGSCEGEDGADSTVPGPVGGDGQNATDAQIAAAVAQFCSTRDDCRGKDAPAPTNGKDAPRITSSFCDPDDRIVLVFDDTTAVTVADSDCRVDLLPEPEPEPDPPSENP